MLSLELLELGYQIDVSGDELRGLTAFVSDPKVQVDSSLDRLSEFLQEWVIAEPFWLDDDWPEKFEQPPDATETP